MEPEALITEQHQLGLEYSFIVTLASVLRLDYWKLKIETGNQWGGHFCNPGEREGGDSGQGVAVEVGEGLELGLHFKDKAKGISW